MLRTIQHWMTRVNVLLWVLSRVTTGRAFIVSVCFMTDRWVLLTAVALLSCASIYFRRYICFRRSSCSSCHMLGKSMAPKRSGSATTGRDSPGPSKWIRRASSPTIVHGARVQKPSRRLLESLEARLQHSQVARRQKPIVVSDSSRGESDESEEVEDSPEDATSESESESEEQNGDSDHSHENDSESASESTSGSEERESESKPSHEDSPEWQGCCSSRESASDVERDENDIPLELIRSHKEWQSAAKSSKGKTPIKLTENTVYHEDLVHDGWKPPAQDALRVPTHDTMFSKYYKGVINLPAASLLNTRRDRMIQTASLDMWFKNCGNVNLLFLHGLYTFQLHEGFVNLSRVDPRVLSTQRVSSLSNNFAIGFATRKPGNARYAMCVSIIYVTDCTIARPRPSLNLDMPGMRAIDGDFLVQEFERLLGCLGVLYKTDTFVIDLFTHHPQFCTYVERNSELSVLHASVTPTKPTSYAVTVASPRSVPGTSSARLAKPSSEEIPLYDFSRRDSAFDPSKDLFPAKYGAPRYDRDFPPGSLAMVVYTVNTYTSKKDGTENNLGFNLHWVALLGTMQR